MPTPVILAGGLGTRLRPVTGEIPKVLAEVRGRPFITCLLRQLVLAGFGKAVISIGYGADSVVDALGPEFDGMALEYCREESPLGTGGAARLALDLVGGPVMTMNGDSIVNAPLSDFVRAALSDPGEPMLLAVKVPDVSRYGSLEIQDGRIVRFAEKGGRGSGWINAGVYYFPGPELERLPLGESASLEKDVLEKLGGRLRAYACESDFIDIGTPESYSAGQSLKWLWRSDA
jgi:D-glycero-alpha-D-manno-heptose 1-phosphate guanylyltransferase